jgi:hypothetical protein
MLNEYEIINLQIERMKTLKKLEEIDGIKRKGNVIPDYIDPKFARNKKKYSKQISKDLMNGENIVDGTKKKELSSKNSKKKNSKSKRTNIFENTEFKENKRNVENSVYKNNKKK